MKTQVKVKKLHESAILPMYAREGDSGMDLISIEFVDIAPGKAALVGTGISLEIPQGCEGQVRSRSGLAIKNQIIVLNSPGTIDSGYRGEVKVILMNMGDSLFKVSAGDRIAQIVICPVICAELHEVQSLEDSIRGVNGFGSTGVSS